MSYLYLFLADKQLGQHDAGQRLGVVVDVVTGPVDAVKSTEDDVAVLFGHDGTHIELIAEKTVGHIVVIEVGADGAVFYVTLDDDAADAVAGGQPDVVFLVFGDAADVVVTQSLLLGNIVQTVADGVQNVDALASAHPDQSTGVFKDLGDVVVGERLEVGGVTCQMRDLRRRQIEDGESFAGANKQLVVSGIVKGGNAVGGELAILLGVAREGVHLGVEHLKAAVGGYPQVAHLVSTKRVDVVVNECARTVLCCRVDGGTAILDTRQSVLFGTHPQAAVAGIGHSGHFLTGQRSVVINDAFVARTIEDVSVLVLGKSGNVAHWRGVETVDVLAVIGDARLLRTYPEQVGVVDIDALNPQRVGVHLPGIHVLGFGYLHFTCVHVHLDESGAVCSYPDITAAVAAHSVDGVVNADARQAELVADGGVPGVGAFLIDEEGALPVEPDVVHLVGKGFQRTALTQLLYGDAVGDPHGVLLVHDIAASNTPVVVDNQRTVATFADGADVALRYAVSIVGVGKLIKQLLLHVVADDALVGDGTPDVLVLVDIDDVGNIFYTHAGERLLHLPFE